MQRGGAVLMALTILILSVSITHAQSGGVYEVWGNVGAGGTVSGGAYQIAATIGQPEAGQISGGDYTLGGGFWGGGVVVKAADKYKVYLPVVIR